MSKLKSCSIVHVHIMKEFKSRNIEFHTYNPKQKRGFKIVLKYMLLPSNVDIRKEIINVIMIITVTNIWNIKTEQREQDRLF